MSASPKQIGVIVIGLGIAGKVRVRDLKEGVSGFFLKGVVSRRPVQLEDVQAYSFEEAMSDPDVGAVMICTEPGNHEVYIRKSLENDKHVLVEYPLALSSETARCLHTLAETKGLILHEENIAMLTETYIEVKKKAASTPLVSADYCLKSRHNGWIEDFDKSGLPFVSGVSTLQCMISLFGDLKVQSGSLIYEGDGGYTAQANLLTATGSPISLTRAAFKEQKRQKQEVYTFTDGVLDLDKLNKTTNSKPGLFMQDMLLFYNKILNCNTSSEAKDLTIASLQLAEEIHSHFTNPSL